MVNIRKDTIFIHIQNMLHNIFTGCNSKITIQMSQKAVQAVEISQSFPKRLFSHSHIENTYRRSIPS